MSIATAAAPVGPAAHEIAEPLPHPKYRRDIDGLRAVAVLAVVIYHAFPEWMPGGFIGVDIFFVISGFLISTILFASLESGSFTFAAFYTRRIRRIFPALIVVLVVSLLMGWTLLWQDEYKQLGNHVSGGAAFLANFVLWGESGYFDTAAASKPLLHLWSLAIEEQFYIFYPAVLWFAWKRRFNLLTVTVLIALVSFGLNIATVRSDPVAAFYLPHTRFWELMAGAILAHITLHAPAAAARAGLRVDRWLNGLLFAAGRANDGNTLLNGLSLLGAGLLAAGFFLIARKAHFPGWWALLPTVGTVLLISGGARGWINRVALSNPVLVWIGLISYPLYLWHWVLLSFARIVVRDVPQWEVRLFLVCAAVLLSWITYKLIETPMRLGKAAKTKTLVLMMAMVAVCLAGSLTYLLEGVPDRYVLQHSVTMKSGEDGGFGGMNLPCVALGPVGAHVHCYQDPREAPRYALLGDSKAGALASGAFRNSIPGGRWIFLGINTLPMVPAAAARPAASAAVDGPARGALALESIAKLESVKIVVIASAARVLFRLAREDTIEDLPQSPNYDMAFQGMLMTAESWIKAGKKVVLFVDNPTLPPPQDCLTRITSIGFINDAVGKTKPNCRLDLSTYLRHREQYMKMLAEVQKRHPGDIEIFDATDLLCDRAENVCPAARGGRALYGFTDHISDYASGLVGKELNAFLAAR